MTGQEILSAVALVVGVGTPVFTMLRQATKAGRLLQRLDSIEEKQIELLAREKSCQDRRETEEASLHGRVTIIQDRVSRLEGRCNGHAPH
jgi:hypothetical protein